MGLTIHYALRSKLRSASKAQALVEQLRQRALDLPFLHVSDLIELSGDQCNFEKRPDNCPHRWMLIQAAADISHRDRRGNEDYYTVPPSHVIAFTAHPGPGCEPMNVGLCRYPSQIEIMDRNAWPAKQKTIRTKLTGWRWASFCKTQYASNPDLGGVENFVRCHLSVVRLLDYAKELNLDVEVDDEGGYWQRRDVDALAKEVGGWNEMIAGWAGRLKDAFGNEVESAITTYPDFERLEARGRARGDK